MALSSDVEKQLIKSASCAGKMVKVLAAKPENINSVPEPHATRGNQLLNNTWR